MQTFTTKDLTKRLFKLQGYDLDNKLLTTISKKCKDSIIEDCKAFGINVEKIHDDLFIESKKGNKSRTNKNKEFIVYPNYSD